VTRILITFAKFDKLSDKQVVVIPSVHIPNARVSKLRQEICKYDFSFVKFYLYIIPGQYLQITATKVKVKSTLEQAMKAQRGSRGIAPPFFNLGA
jgi:hypothetical protein